MCDDNALIANIVAQWPGSTHDSSIFDNSHLCAMLEQQEFQGHLVGDNGYPCRAYLMTLLLNAQTPAERRYNACHITERGLVERVFGVCKQRFPCLQDGLCTKLDTTLTVIVTVAVLYNFGERLGDELSEEADEDPHEERDDQEHHSAATVNGNAVCRTLIEKHF